MFSLNWKPRRAFVPSRTAAWRIMRVLAVFDGFVRAELRSADCTERPSEIERKSLQGAYEIGERQSPGIAIHPGSFRTYPLTRRASRSIHVQVRAGTGGALRSGFAAYLGDSGTSSAAHAARRVCVALDARAAS